MSVTDTNQSEFSEEEQNQLSKLGEQIKEKHFALEQNTSRRKMEIAELFVEANKQFATGGRNSKFEEWINALSIGLKKSSVYNYIAIYMAFGDFEHFEKIVWSAMRELSEERNEQACEAAKAEASQGNRVSIQRAKELIAKHSKTVQSLDDSMGEAKQETVVVHSSQEKPRSNQSSPSRSTDGKANSGEVESGDNCETVFQSQNGEITVLRRNIKKNKIYLEINCDGPRLSDSGGPVFLRR